MTIWGKNIFAHCALTLGAEIFDSKTISSFRFHSSKLEREEFNRFAANPCPRSNLVHLEPSRIIRNRKIVEGYDSSYSPIDSPGTRRLRDRRLESKRTKGMHNVTWDEIRGGMCVKRKTARRYKAVMCRLCGFPELGDLAFSRALCPPRFKGADATRDQAGEGVNYKLERKGWKRRRRCMRE